MPRARRLADRSDRSSCPPLAQRPPCPCAHGRFNWGQLPYVQRGCGFGWGQRWAKAGTSYSSIRPISTGIGPISTRTKCSGISPRRSPRERRRRLCGVGPGGVHDRERRRRRGHLPPRRHGASFQVRADAKEGFRINVDLNNLPAPDLPPGPLPLGWKHDGHMLFRLSGSGGRFTASPSGPWALVDLAGWMEHLDGSLALNEITLPGTHDTCARAPSSRSPSCR